MHNVIALADWLLWETTKTPEKRPSFKEEGDCHPSSICNWECCVPRRFRAFDARRQTFLLAS